MRGDASVEIRPVIEPVDRLARLKVREGEPVEGADEVLNARSTGYGIAVHGDDENPSVARRLREVDEIGTFPNASVRAVLVAEARDQRPLDEICRAMELHVIAAGDHRNPSARGIMIHDFRITEYDH